MRQVCYGHGVLQHTATHTDTLQHTAPHCTPLQHTTTHCNTLQHTATHCNAPQHTDFGVPCGTLVVLEIKWEEVKRKVLQFASA